MGSETVTDCKNFVFSRGDDDNDNFLSLCDKSCSDPVVASSDGDNDESSTGELSTNFQNGPTLFDRSWRGWSRMP